MLNRDKTAFLLIDVQGRLASLMHESDSLINNLELLIKGMRLLEIPVIWVEHLPEKLGPTVEKLQNVLSGLKPIRKNVFSCAGSSEIMDCLLKLNVDTLILAGIESHVCVYQTAKELLDKGFLIQIAADGTSSRTSRNREIGIQRMMQEGASITSVEMVLFELQKIAEGPVFKDLIRLIK
jgi:nicotinamidase-related amidase